MSWLKAKSRSSIGLALLAGVIASIFLSHQAGLGQEATTKTTEGTSKPSPQDKNKATSKDSVVVPEKDTYELPKQEVEATVIDLGSALRLAGVENPEILVARQRVVEAMALQQLAAAQLLPNLNVGLNYSVHNGALQQSSGNILKVDRSSLYVGAGANAVGSGTVNIPGLSYNLNLSNTLFDILVSRQEVARSEFANQALQNQILRRVASRYAELLWAEGRRSIAHQGRDEAFEVARIVNAFVKAGQKAQADADRASTELDHRRNDLVQAEAEVAIASARLVEVLGLDKQVFLHPIEEQAVPAPMVPDLIPLRELLAIALFQRPELAQWQVAIRQAMLAHQAARVLPFSPNLMIGLSGGDFGGGSDLVNNLKDQSRFGNFGTRNDLDVVSYWTLQNLGIGNHALVKIAESRIGNTELEKLVVLNQVRREVAEALVRSQARQAQVAIQSRAVRSGQEAFNGDMRRIRGGEGNPLALLESLQLLLDARNRYLDAIVGFNIAQIDLYVSIGKPPADMLARPIPTQFRTPLEEPKDKMKR